MSSLHKIVRSFSKIKSSSSILENDPPGSQRRPRIGVTQAYRAGNVPPIYMGFTAVKFLCSFAVSGINRTRQDTGNKRLTHIKGMA